MAGRSNPEVGTQRLLSRVDGEIEREERIIEEHRAALSALRETRRRLARKVKPRAVSVKSALQRAGRGNVEAARQVVTKRMPRPAIAAAMAERRGVRVNDGVVSYALKALEEDGVIRRLPDRDGSGALVFEPVRRRGAVARPGGR